VQLNENPWVSRFRHDCLKERNFRSWGNWVIARARMQGKMRAGRMMMMMMVVVFARVGHKAAELMSEGSGWGDRVAVMMMMMVVGRSLWKV
jgi:hypothetical protein